MIKTLEIRVYFHSWIQAAYHYQSCLLYSIQFFFPRLARHEVQLEQQLGLYIWQVRIIILSLIKMERMKLQCFGVTSEEIRYRRIGNERRIPFAFWPSSQKCLHRPLLIVLYRSKPLPWKKQGLRRSSFIHAKFDNMTSLLLTQRESSFHFSPSPWDTGLLLMPNRIPLNRIRSSYSLPVSKKPANFLGKGYNVLADLAWTKSGPTLMLTN